MSTAQAPAAAPASYTEVCPLCGEPLAPTQDWCLRCGAAAHTRVAATPGWRAPVIVAVVLAVVCLGVLAGALVKLARGPGPAPPTVTLTVPAGAGSPGGTGATPGATSTP